MVLPYRQIHLDFHTGPDIRDVGVDFDADAFAETMAAAHVNSVTVFAKCHHGHLYYETDRPERHPGLKPGTALLERQVEALHQRGIRAPIYISVQCDEYAANTHPEWIALDENAAHVKRPAGRFTAGWQIVDMSSPYQDFLVEQTEEILRKFDPVDGIFFDMCWDQPSTSTWAVAGMRRQDLDPESAADRGIYARRVALAYMERLHGLVKQAGPQASVFFNCRPFFNLAEDIRYQEQVEIEALPTGGWGYMYFPINVRYARTFDKPYMGMTARFHKSWADFGGLKPQAALEYETSQMIAHGARCSVGDQLHPRGTLDRGAYELIGAAYKRVAQREPWIEGARPVCDVGLFQLPTGNLGTTQSTSDTDEGATRMLTQLRHQFDVVQSDSDFSAYELLVLPDGLRLDDALVGRLREFVARGGALLATGTSGLSDDGSELLLPELRIDCHGMSPFTATYIRFGDAIAEGVPDSDHVMYEPGVRVTPQGDAAALAGVVEPYFERAWNHFSSHRQTPGDALSPFAAATQAGRVGYVSYPIFRAFARHGNYPYRLLVERLLQRLLPNPLLRVSGPTGLESSVMQREDRHIIHLLYYPAERRARGLDLVEDIVPLYDLRVSLRRDEAPQKVTMVPEGATLPFEYDNGRVEVRLPQLVGHAMIEVV